jgi:O-antigen/teichoic acid export membrane protein
VRTRRSILNYATGTVSSLVVLVTGFIATPYVLRWLGEERFGAFRAANDWFGYLSLLEFGVGGALLALLAKAVGHGDASELRSTLVTGVRWYIRVALLMLAVGIGLAFVITRLVPVSSALTGDLRSGILIAVFAVLILPFGAPFKALAESRQRGYWINALLLLQSLSITAMALVSAAIGWGITGQFAALVFGAILFNLPLVWSGLRQYPGILRSALTETPNPDTEAALRRLNRPTLVYNLAGRFSFETDNIIVAYMLGPTMVVPLFITQKLIMMAAGQLVSIGNASWAALAELHFRGHGELFNRRLVELTGLVAVLGVALLVPVAIYNGRFVAEWVGPEYFAGIWVSVVAAINVYLRAVLALWGWCFGGTARTPLVMRASVAETLINVTLSVALTWKLGLIGPLIGTLVGLVSVSLWYLPRLLRREFGTPLDQLTKSVVSPLVLGVPYAWVLWWVATTYEPVGWITLSVHMGTAALVYLVLWWGLMLDREKRAVVNERLETIFRRRPS